MSKWVWSFDGSGGEGQKGQKAESAWKRGSSHKLGTAETTAVGCILTGTKMVLELPNFYLERGATAAWIIALLGMAGALVAWRLVVNLCKKQPGRSLSEIFRHYLGGFLGNFVNLGILLYFFFNSAMYIQQFSALIAKVSLAFITLIYIFLFFIASAFCQAFPGIVALGRASYLTLIITVVESLILVTASFFHFRINAFLPLAGTGWREVFWTGSFALSSFCEVIALGYLTPYFSYPVKKLWKAGAKSILIAGSLLLMILVSYLNNFSLGENGSSYTPFFELTRVTGIGYRDKQMESLFLIGWAVAAFAQTALHLSLLSVMLEQMLPVLRGHYKKILPAVTVLSGFLAYGLLTGKHTVIFDSRKEHFLIGPIIFLLPIVTYLIALWRDRPRGAKGQAEKQSQEEQQDKGKRFWRTGGLLCLFLLLLPLTGGCENRRETNEIYYVIMLGIDTGEEKQYRFTFQLARQANFSGSSNLSLGGDSGAKEEDSGSQKEDQSSEKGEKPKLNPNIFSVESDDIWSALQMAEAFTSRSIELGQLQFLLFGEELCRNGVEPVAKMLLQHDDVPRKCFLLMSRGEAIDFIAENKIALESHVGRQLKSMLKTCLHTGYTVGSSLHSFISDLWEPGKEPILGVVAISQEEGAKPSHIDEPDETMDYFAGEIPKLGGGNVEAMGAALFKDGQLAEVLDGTTTRYLNILKNNPMEAILSLNIENPKGIRPMVLDLIYDDGLSMKMENTPAEKLVTIPEGPWGKRPVTTELPRLFWHLTVKVDIEKANLSTELPRSGPEEKAKMEQLVAGVMEENLSELILHLQELGIDCVGFSAEARRLFATWQDWAYADWESLFKEGSIRLEVEVRDRSLEDIFWSKEDHYLDQYLRHGKRE